MKDQPTPLPEVLRALDFAARKHRDQRRKGSERAPYINHLIEVSMLLAGAGVTDLATLQAAVLHDTLEDTETTREELRQQFGVSVSAIVEELTDQKSLPKQLRKLLQVRRAGGLSISAKLIKIADKISNIRGVVFAPPEDWSLARRRAYLEWTARVVEGCRGLNSDLERLYDETLEHGHAFLSGAGQPDR